MRLNYPEMLPAKVSTVSAFSAKVSTVSAFSALVLLCISPPSSASIGDYARLADTDESTCMAPCVRALQPCGYGTNATCNATLLAAACDASAECLAFNSNGWLKGCASPACGGVLEPSPNTTLFVKNNGSWPQRPVAPVVDWHYAPERAAEEARLAALLPLVADIGNGWAILSAPPLPDANVSVDGAYAGFVLLAAWAAPAPAVAVVERAFATWAATSLLRPGGEAARLPRTVGRVFALDRSAGAPNYTALTRDQPDYYDAAVALNDDVLGARILAASPYGGEPTFAAAASFFPAQRDYASIGAQAAAIKYSVAPDGRVKAASGAIYTPATNGSAEKQPGTLVFDSAAIADWWPLTNWSVTKAGLVGGFLRVVATAGFDAATGRGVEQLSFAPAADASGAAIVRLRSTDGTTPDGLDRSATGFRYFNATASAGVRPREHYEQCRRHYRCAVTHSPPATTADPNCITFS